MRLTTLAALTLLPTLVPSLAVAQSGDYDGYLPDEPHPQQSSNALDQLSLAEPARSPIRGGMSLGIGVTVPTGGELETATGQREIRGTGDVGGGIQMLIHDALQLDFGVRGGLGGIDPDLYERLYGYEELGGRHLWLGIQARFMPVAIGSLRPTASVLFGGDRIFAANREATGVYECEDNGVVTTCREQTERTFAAGYWGRSMGFGGGLFIAFPGDTLALTVDVYALNNSYGRRTNSETENLSLADPISTWSVGTLVLMNVFVP